MRIRYKAHIKVNRGYSEYFVKGLQHNELGPAFIGTSTENYYLGNSIITGRRPNG